MIPDINYMLLGQCFNLGEIHHHAIGSISILLDDIAGQGNFQRIAVPMQMPALTLVIGNTMTCVKLQAAGDEHGESRVKIREGLYHRAKPTPTPNAMLSITDHNRDTHGFRYAYPVVSRRAGGVSVGINLNPNNACNWACVYCQVPDLKRGGPPPIDVPLLRHELETLLEDIIHGDFMLREVPEDARVLMDIAFSGNGEPTSAPEFPQVVECVLSIMHRFELLPKVKLRLITNGSLLHRKSVQEGIRKIGEVGGEVWFKFDRATKQGIKTVNKVVLDPDKALHKLERCADLAPTWVQTCWFEMDGIPPNESEQAAYIIALKRIQQKIKGVHLYGIARPSLQPEAYRLNRLSPDSLKRFAQRISDLGITTSINP